MLAKPCKCWQDIIIFVVVIVKMKCKKLWDLSSKRFCCVKIHKEVVENPHFCDRFT